MIDFDFLIERSSLANAMAQDGLHTKRDVQPPANCRTELDRSDEPFDEVSSR